MNILEHIQELCNERGWTVYRLADEAGLTQSTLTNMFYRKTLPSLNTLLSICNAFGITPSQFFNYGNVTVSLSSEEENVVKQYRKLNKENKRLIRVILDEMTSQ